MVRLRLILWTLLGCRLVRFYGWCDRFFQFSLFIGFFISKNLNRHDKSKLRILSHFKPNQLFTFKNCYTHTNSQAASIIFTLYAFSIRGDEAEHSHTFVHENNSYSFFYELHMLLLFQIQDPERKINNLSIYLGHHVQFFAMYCGYSHTQNGGKMESIWDNEHDIFKCCLWDQIYIVSR